MKQTGMDTGNRLEQQPLQQIPMPQLLIQQLPSLDFVAAVARFLETDPDDILTELGYHSHTSTSPESCIAQQHNYRQADGDDGSECSDYYLG